MSSRNESDKENIFRYSNVPERKSNDKNTINLHKKAFEKVEINERDHFILNEYKYSNSESEDIVNKIKTLRSEKSFSE